MKQKSITVITRDNIRTLRPHGTDAARRKSGPAYTVSGNDLDRIKNSAVFMSKDELEEYNHELNNQRLTAAEMAKARKAKMEEYDHQRSSNAKLSALEQETKDKSNYLLSKARVQLEEQEDEIKHMNELMLYAKCVAIRDVQVEEKKMIARERKDEEARLDAMMEVERVNELKKLEEREKKRIEEMRKGAAKIRHQIDERREAALLEQERRDQETKQILKAIADMNEQFKLEKLNKIKAQRAMMLEVAKANHESTERKRHQKLAEEDEDKKVLQYILDKEQRAVEKDRQEQKKKAEREQELARLRAAQEKMSDKQAQQDALRAQRAYEAYEREWRRKEKETAEKQKLQESELKAERFKQQRAREHAIAVEARKMKDEFFENLKRQKEVEERIKAEELLKHEKNRLYSTEVQTQIREKEALRKKQREEFFMEGVRLAQERLEKKNKIDQIKERKIQELRNIGRSVKTPMTDQLDPDAYGEYSSDPNDQNNADAYLHSHAHSKLREPVQQHDYAQDGSYHIEHMQHPHQMGSMAMMHHYDPYQHQSQQHHPAYMNPLHMQGFHHMPAAPRFMGHGDFASFAPVSLTLIEGGAGFRREGGGEELEGGVPMEAVPHMHHDLAASFMHPVFSPGLPHTAMMGMGMVDVGLDGAPAMRFDKRPDSPNAWGWVTNNDHHLPVDENGSNMMAHVGMMGSEGVHSGEMMQQQHMPHDHQDSHLATHEMDPMAAAGYIMNRMNGRMGFMGGMSGAHLPHDDSFEGNDDGIEGTCSSSNQGCEDDYGNSQDNRSTDDKSQRRGKGAVYCVHKKILNRCDECSTLGNPSQVITRVSAVCHHGKRRSQCIQCYDEGTGGSIICEHRRQKYACPKCFDAGRETKSLCQHRTIKFKCKICSPTVHQPKSYKKRVGKRSGNDGERSPYNGKKRASTGRSKRSSQSSGHGHGGFDHGNGMGPGNGGMGGNMSQQQPLFYHPHHPMMYSMPIQGGHSMHPHAGGGGGGQAPGYMFHAGPPGSVPLIPIIQGGGSGNASTSTAGFISTPLPTRRGSPELGKPAPIQTSAFVPGSVGSGGVSILVPTMMPLSFPRHASSAVLTPTISPPSVNMAIASMASENGAPPPPAHISFGAKSSHLAPAPLKAKSSVLPVPMSPHRSPNTSKRDVIRTEESSRAVESASTDVTTSADPSIPASEEVPVAELTYSKSSVDATEGDEAEEAAATMVTILYAASSALRQEEGPASTTQEANSSAGPVAVRERQITSGRIIGEGSSSSSLVTPFSRARPPHSYYPSATNQHAIYMNNPHQHQSPYAYSPVVMGYPARAGSSSPFVQPVYYAHSSAPRDRSSTNASAAPELSSGSVDGCAVADSAPRPETPTEAAGTRAANSQSAISQQQQQQQPMYYMWVPQRQPYPMQYRMRYASSSSNLAAYVHGGQQEGSSGGSELDQEEDDESSEEIGEGEQRGENHDARLCEETSRQN
ncbi:Cilia- and flagella-associated protein 45 [Chytriomyces hyalinus]|nr:Cilia- and flagella-associated protein 45 [Chytriomyces hyalinus]